MKIQVNGHKVHYNAGSGSPAADAPVIVFVHGAGFDGSVWVMPARYFARHGYRVVAPDLPGHGRSEGPALTSIEAMAAWVVDLVAALPAERFAIFGHSMGSLVAMETALRYSDKVTHLALLGASAPMPVGAPLLNAAEDDHAAAFAMANTWSHSAQGQLGASASPGMSNLNSGQRWLERNVSGTYFADLGACNAYQGALQEFAMPALVIAGSDDKMTPVRAGLSLAQACGVTQTCVLPGCGHSMLSEQPNQVLDALITLMQTQVT